MTGGVSLYISKQKDLAKDARRKCFQRDLHAWTVPNLWSTREMEEEPQALRDAKECSPELRNCYDAVQEGINFAILLHELSYGVLTLQQCVEMHICISHCCQDAI